MKKLFFAIVLVVVLPALAIGQESAKEKERINAILDVVREWDNAYVRKDALIVKKLLAEDYIGIDHDGEVTRKADEIALVKSGDYVLLSVEQVEPQKVRFYGGTAIVTSYSNVRLKLKGKETNFVGRATTVCAEKKGGQWEIVSWHASKVGKK